MRIIFKNSFAKDLKKVKDQNLKQMVISTIETIEQAKGLAQLSNTKKLKGDDCYYRIKLGDYRIGIIIEDDVVTFVRILHRKDIYRHFP